MRTHQEKQQPPRQEVKLGTTTAADNVERHHKLDAGARADHGGDLPVFLRDEWTLPNESEEAERTDHLQARFPALPRPVVQHALREHRGHAGHTAAALGVPHLRRALTDAAEVLGDRNCCVCREMTKVRTTTVLFIYPRLLSGCWFSSFGFFSRRESGDDYANYVP